MKTMTRSEFIGKLWGVYVGDKEAMELLTNNYMEMQKVIVETTNEIERLSSMVQIYPNKEDNWIADRLNDIKKILKGEEVE